MDGKQWRIVENNGELSKERLTIEENKSLGTISADYRRGREIIDQARDYLQLESARLSDNGLAIMVDKVGRLDQNSISKIIRQRHVFLGDDLPERLQAKSGCPIPRK